MTRKYKKIYGGNTTSSSERKNKAATKLQTTQRKKLAKLITNKLKSTRKIQSQFRGNKTRKNLLSTKSKLSDQQHNKIKLLESLFQIKSKTYSNYDKFISENNFSRINLEGKKLIGKKLNNVNFAYANLKKTFLTSAKFIDANLIGANLTGAKISNTNFTNAKLKNANLSEIIESADAKFINANLTNSTLYDNMFTDVNFFGVNLTNSKISYTAFIRPTFAFSNFLKTSFDNCTFNDFTFNDVYGNAFYNVNFSYTKFLNTRPFESLIFRNCTFNNCVLDNTKFTDIDFIRCKFINTELNNCNFTDVIFKFCKSLNTNFELSYFKNVDFLNSTNNKNKFSGSIFDNCNFENTDLNDSIFSSFAEPYNTVFNNVNFIDTQMKNVAFNSIFLQNMNFNNAMLDGATFIGSDLAKSSFVNASLKGTNFYWSDINNTDFTNAIINEHTNFNNVIGINDNTRGLEARLNVGRAIDTHNAWANINMELLFNFFSENNVSCSDYPQTNDDFKKLLKTYLYELLKNIDETPENKLKLKKNLDKCFTDSIDEFELFFSPANTTTTKTVAQMIICSINYVNIQSIFFKNIYITSIISDIIAGHGPDGMSCPKGAIERLITYIASAAHAYNLNYQGSSNEEIYEKFDEYNKLINIIENTDELRLDQFRKQWFDEHREGSPAKQRTENSPPIPAIEPGPKAFPPGTSIEFIMKDYENFLKEKFGLNQNIFNQEQRTALEDLIYNDPKNGIKAVKENLENFIYFLGGKRK